MPRTWLGLGVKLAELADELAEQAGLPMAGLDQTGWLAGWLAAGLKSIGRDLWGERERVRRRREGEGRGLQQYGWLQCKEPNERANRTGEETHAHTEHDTRQDTTRQVRARKRGTVDRLTGKHALAGGTDWLQIGRLDPQRSRNGRAMGGFKHKTPLVPPRA